MNSADTTAQPAPVPNDRPAIADLVLADIRHRVEYGVRKYGTKLQPHNGRDALADAYQEALDLVMYLRQEIEERRPTPTPDRPLPAWESEEGQRRRFEVTAALWRASDDHQQASIYLSRIRQLGLPEVELAGGLAEMRSADIELAAAARAFVAVMEMP